MAAGFGWFHAFLKSGTLFVLGSKTRNFIIYLRCLKAVWRMVMKKTKVPDKSLKRGGKLIYWHALLPVLSTGLYLLLMSVGQTENFAVFGILVFLVSIVIWGICGALFARSGITFMKAALIGNAFPLFCSGSSLPVP